jgi:hypothetical protein
MKKDKTPTGLFATNNLGLVDKPAPQLLKERFVVPPFSILNVMQDYWQRRKQAWIGLGIQGELGRGENLLKFSDSVRLDGESYKKNFSSRPKSPLQNPGNDRDFVGANPSGRIQDDFTPAPGKGQVFGPLPGAGVPRYDGSPKGKTGYAECMKTNICEKFGRQKMSATSIFDPVLCELAYRWFCPTGGHILDPFAGGSVRGIVAAHLDYKYTGVDLSPFQIEANRIQAQEICPNNPPTWYNGDSSQIKSIAPGKYDLVFSCPPYFDLEVYSEDPRDLSRMSIKGFIEAYRQIIKDCVSMLSTDRFACWVIGEVREKTTGFYQGLVPETIRAFEDAGAGFYNEIILFTAIGTLPVRVNKQFNSGRKIGKAHQNVLVFFKGDPKNIKTTFGKVVDE